MRRELLEVISIVRECGEKALPGAQAGSQAPGELPGDVVILPADPIRLSAFGAARRVRSLAGVLCHGLSGPESTRTSLADLITKSSNSPLPLRFGVRVADTAHDHADMDIAEIDMPAVGTIRVFSSDKARDQAGS